MSWFTIFADVSGRKHPGIKHFSGMKHPETHKVAVTHYLGRDTGFRQEIQVIVLEGCQGVIISLLTLFKCRMVCNLCYIVYYLVVSFLEDC